jgi:A/G-specific adenine glycosylase
MTFAFGRRAVLVDTNTTRIVTRITGHGDDRLWQVRLDLHKLAGGAGPDAEFNYALLDLGALVCRSGEPLCDGCPVAGYCAHASERTGSSQETLF